MSPESGWACLLPDTAAAHYKGHESARRGVTRAVWATTDPDWSRWEDR